LQDACQIAWFGQNVGKFARCGPDCDSGLAVSAAKSRSSVGLHTCDGMKFLSSARAYEANFGVSEGTFATVAVCWVSTKDDR
jgi:hypothetical protein